MIRVFFSFVILFFATASTLRADDLALSAEILKGRESLGLQALPPLPGPEERERALAITSSNVAVFHDLLIAPLASWINDGWFVIRAVSQTTYPWNYGFRWQRGSAANLKKLKLDESGSIESVKGGSLNIKGFPFGSARELKKSASSEELASKIIWNLASIDSLISDLLYGFEINWLGFQSRIKRAEGLLYRRSYPMEISQTFGPSYPFRNEVLTFFSPPVIFGYAQVLTRFLGQDEDSLWLYSPVVARKRELLPSNRSDAILGSNLTLDDLFVWSGKVQEMDAVVLEEKTLLVPVASLSILEAVHEEVVSDAKSLLFPSKKEVLSGQLTLGKKTKLQKVLTVRGLEQSREGDNAFVGWNYETSSVKQAAAWIPTTAYFVPREVWIIELSPRDPYYSSGRQVIAVDKESFLPVYKIVYNTSGEYERLNMGFWSIVVDKQGKRRFPILTSMLSVDAHSRQAIVWNTRYVRSFVDSDSPDTRELRRLLNIDEHVKLHQPEEEKPKKAKPSSKRASAELKPAERKPAERKPVPLRPLDE